MALNYITTNSLTNTPLDVTFDSVTCNNVDADTIVSVTVSTTGLTEVGSLEVAGDITLLSPITTTITTSGNITCQDFKVNGDLTYVGKIKSSLNNFLSAMTSVPSGTNTSNELSLTNNNSVGVNNWTFTNREIVSGGEIVCLISCGKVDISGYSKAFVTIGNITQSDGTTSLPAGCCVFIKRVYTYGGQIQITMMNVGTVSTGIAWKLSLHHMVVQATA